MKTPPSIFILSSTVLFLLRSQSVSWPIRALSNETVCEDDPEFEKFCGGIVKVKDEGGTLKKQCKANNADGLGRKTALKLVELVIYWRPSQKTNLQNYRG